jgi:Tol biopolymer transport system component
LFARPEWSPDGKQIAFDADTIDPEYKWDFELYNVNKQGEETKITDLSSVYKSVFMEYFKWSPKGDRIAIWIDYSQQGEHEPFTKLSVVDLQKGEIINYCIGSGAGTPMWSPDGQQIITGIFKDGSYPIETVLVDIANSIAVPLDIEGYPVAWIKYPLLKE